MKRKLLIVVVVALAAATVSTVVFYQLISDNLAGNTARKSEQHPVVTAARDLPRGTRLTAEDLRVITWSGEKPSGAFAQADELAGRLVDRDVQRGEPIFDSGLTAPGQSAGAGSIPPGMRAVSIHLSEYAGVAKLLQNGDKVDVLAADADRRPGNLNARVHTVLQGVVVLDTGKEENPGARRASPPVVTLLVEAKDAELLSLADQAGAIRFALRNPLDDSTAENAGANWQDLLSRRSRRRGSERASAPPRNVSQARQPARPDTSTPKTGAPETAQNDPAQNEAARNDAGRDDIAAVLPELHSRRPSAKNTPAMPAESQGVLLAITFAGVGDEALSELTAGLEQRYAGDNVILSAFRPGWDVSKRVRALQQAERLEVFADPSLLAITGSEAYFERASNAPQDASSQGQRGAKAEGCSDRVGVRVGFRPTIGAGQRLRIRVTSEVAVPDTDQTVPVGDCQAPLVALREWSGEIELADGQSFWVRGLIDRPGAWDLLRRLFPQRPLEYDRNDELAILVTPKLVAAGKDGKPLTAALAR